MQTRTTHADSSKQTQQVCVKAGRCESQKVLIYWTILDAAFQCRSHPHYPSVGNNTRRLVIQLNIPDHAETLFSYGIEFRYVSASCLNIDVAFSSETERRLENDLNVACRFPS